MRWGPGPLLRAAALAGAMAPWLLVAACAPPAEQSAVAAGEAAREAEWQWLARTKKELDAHRARLAAARKAALPAADGAPAAPAPDGKAAGAVGIADPAVLEQQIDLAAEELNRRLVDFINSEPPQQGEPLTARQLRALRMRSDEDIRLAREYIAEGGDYRRAIEILRAALLVDPGNRRLVAEVARTERGRFMTRARFDQVKEGMTAEQVQVLLGAPNPHNVREYPARGVVAWFYPKTAAGAAAAVWFGKPAALQRDPGPPETPQPGRLDAAAALTVYQVDFDAVRPQAERPAPPAAPAPRRRTAATS